MGADSNLIFFHFFFSQVDYQCFDFKSRHHNIIRFRKGVAMIMRDFDTVCSWVQFKNDIKWKYDLMLSKICSKLFFSSKNLSKISCFFSNKI